MANPPYGDSTIDQICPTYASGTISLISANKTSSKGSAGGEFNNDFVNLTGSYQNSFANSTVGSYNNLWANGTHDCTIQPAFRSSLVDFGHTGRQS